MKTDNKTETKLQAHVFVCTNERIGPRECCATKGSKEFREKLKKLVHDKKWEGKVRINTAGCLDKCEEGIAAVIYPAGKWLTNLAKDSVSEMEAAITEILESK